MFFVCLVQSYFATLKVWSINRILLVEPFASRSGVYCISALYFNGLRYSSTLIIKLFQINLLLGQKVRCYAEKYLSTLKLEKALNLTLRKVEVEVLLTVWQTSCHFVGQLLRSSPRQGVNILTVWLVPNSKRSGMTRSLPLSLFLSLFLSLLNIFINRYVFLFLQMLNLALLFLVLFFLNPVLILTSTRVLSIKLFKI